MGFAQRLKEAMDSTHTTMYRLSKILEVHPTTIKNWLDGKSEPKSSTIEKIATALDVPILELLDLKQEAEKISRDDELINKIAFEFDAPIELVRRIVGDQKENSDIEALREIVQVKLNLEQNESQKNTLDKGSRNKALLNEAFDKLNEKGQQKALERVEELTEIPRYQKDKTP